LLNASDFDEANDMRTLKL